jgi:alpha-galactosidase
MAKIAFIGAGSVVFSKQLMSDFLRHPELADATIALMDLDGERLDVARRMGEGFVRQFAPNARIEATLDRRQAIRGADYVICMVQVGMHAATLRDFAIPRKYGLQQTIGDTLGVGGIFRALRTIPVIRGILQDMEEVAPGAVLLNYTNPMAMLCLAAFRTSGVPTVGLCHSVQHTSHQLAAYAGIPSEEVSYKVAGINHMAWFLEFKHRGRDAYPLLRRAMADAAIRAQDPVRFEMLRRLGYFVTESSEHFSEYVPYFIPHAGEIDRLAIPIDEYIRRSEANLREFDQIRRLIDEGGSPAVEDGVEYASGIILAMETGRPYVFNGNVYNRGLITNLPADACVEVPCLIDQNGVQPTVVGDLPPHLAALNRTNINVQQLTVEAALSGKREHVYHAVMLDPLAAATLTLDRIWALCDELIDAHGDLLPPLR